MASTRASAGPQRVERVVHGRPMAFGEHIVTPVSRVSGWRGSNRSGRLARAGAWLRATPVEVVVHEQDGTEQRIAIVDPSAEALRRIGRLAIVTALGCWLVMLLAGRLGRHRPRRSAKEAA